MNNWKKEPTEDDCIHQWGDQPEDKALADNAFIVFCLRFRDRVQRICGEGHNDSVGDEITARTDIQWV